MLNAAESMKSVDRRAEAGQASSSIFGSTAILSDAINKADPYRIAVYPIISDSMPDLAMGILSCLAYLLEQWSGLKVYRCFVKIDENDDEDSDITSADYQFSPADWELEGLDDNLLLHGSAILHDGAAQLTLHIDASMVKAEIISPRTYDYDSVPALIGALPAIAAELVAHLFEQEPLHLIIDYPKFEQDSTAGNLLLEDLFAWNLDLYLSHWGLAWDEEEIASQFLSLARICHQLDSEFAYWCLGMACQQVMRLGLEDIGEVLLAHVDKAFEVKDGEYAQVSQGKALAALGLSRLGYVERALAMLEDLVANGAGASVWHTMISISLDAGRSFEALDICQRALETGISHPALYWQYAELLMMSEANNWLIEEVLLIDPDDIDESEQIPFEIIAALKTLLASQPNNLGALHLALLYMIDVEDGELWDYFEQMVKGDQESAYLGELIERLADAESLTPAYQILRDAIAAPQENPYLYANLAQLALVDGKPQAAKQTLQACRRALETIDEDLELELQRLELSAEVPGFEQSFAEIKVLLNAQRTIRESDVQLLEAAIEIAPSMIDLYVTLSRCYMDWQDNESALEVLGEAKNQAGNHPRIVLGSAQIHWSSMMRGEAIATLNTGIAEFPNDVALLAQIASYLIENGQLDDAKQFVERAESIAPSHGALMQLRRFIANSVSS